MTADRERDEREIANLIARYARLIDDGRAAEAAELFAEDGSWWLGDECKAAGRDAVRELLGRRGAKLERTSRHVCSNLLVEVAEDGASATSSCVLTLWRVDRDEPAPHPVAGPALVGDYVDRFVRADAGWRIQRRELRPVFVATASAAADPERQLPSGRPVCSRRWVPGRHAVVYTAPCLLRSTSTRPAQAYWLDLTTGVETPITSDASFKLYAFAWRAPEFGNDWALFTVADRTRLEVHREIDNGDGTKTWTRVNTVTAPPATPFITSPEPFVHNGKSYVAFTVSASSTTTDFKVPTQIAITGIDPAVLSFRMLTADTTVGHVRMDPEYYITRQGPFIYYNRYVVATPGGPGRLEGVWRVDTGLGPPASN